MIKKERLQKKTNSNNGKNMDTINRYLAQITGGVANVISPGYGSSDVPAAVIDLQNMYMAAVDYLDNLTEEDDKNAFNDFRTVIGGTDNKDQRARRLFAFMCPLRPVVGTIDESGTFSRMTPSSSSLKFG